MSMFHWDKGLILPEAGLSVDITRRQACGFVSHAHGDHLGRHEITYCTAETESLCRLRLSIKPTQVFRAMRFFEPIMCGALKLTAYPAGHCLGSAMLLAESPQSGKRLLYTGDFKLGPSATSVEAVVPKADYLIMESTFGTPDYRMPPREEMIARLIDEVGESFARKRSPVIFAYTLGKGQEVSRLLTLAGFKVQQGKKMYEISEIYEKHGVPLGDVIPLLKRRSEPDRVLVIPAHHCPFETPYPTRTFAVTGWAIRKGAVYQLRVDVAIPLSDHADFDELVGAVERAEPEMVYCTHGGPEFVDHLNDLGFRARPLDRPYQERLF
ncbi:MAG TPA: hypothetical protein DEB39_10225 [Planctomycetaceae bacterium]|nr:hypothetical protein [Planctomycetaceae bacterium]